MTVKDTSFIFANGKLLSLEASQSDSPEITGGLHKGHVVLAFHVGVEIDRASLDGAIKKLAGVDRLYSDKLTTMISIGANGNAFDVAKEVSKALLDQNLITQDEIQKFYSAMDDRSLNSDYVRRNTVHIREIGIR